MTTALDRLEPRALFRALVGERRAYWSRRRRPDGSPSRSVLDHRVRRAATAVKAPTRQRICVVAVDGRTSRGALGEDSSTSRTGHGPADLATLRAAVAAALHDAGYLHIPEGRRDRTTPVATRYRCDFTT